MTQLSVNLNKVALLRNTRDVGVPDVLRAARIAIDAGASGITVHPRPDERHTRPSDVLDLSTFTKEAAVEFNIEGYPTMRFLELVHQVVPVQCTLVPDAPDQRTSDHGWDLEADGVRLRPIIVDLKARGIRVSLFMDPDPAIIAAAAAVGTDRVETVGDGGVFAARALPYEVEFDVPEDDDDALASSSSGSGFFSGSLKKIGRATGVTRLRGERTLRFVFDCVDVDGDHEQQHRRRKQLKEPFGAIGVTMNYSK